MSKYIKKIIAAFFVSAVILPSVSFADGNKESPQASYISVSSEELSAASAERPLVALSGGAWVSSGAGPTLTNKGVTYSLTLPVVGTVPTGSTIPQ
ncbi:MAG: hypothetical protein EOO53_12215 [Gammaproteobacteria bacterium]|nr:MAG: hypothetical protein EOO53_12215 [Gammaproteobacteria bacterium]